MKAKAFLCLCCIVAAVGCTKDDTIMLLSLQEQNQSTRLDRHPFDFYKFSDSAIVLGAKLNNPYSVANLQIARDSLIAEGATPSSLPAINVTHYYARFKPADDDALAELTDRDTTIIYYEFPLDYEIKEYGISYHDPAIADTLPTYQYASVPILKWQNLQNIPNVECTLLEPLCILDEDKDGGTGWDGVEPRDSLSQFEPDPRDTLPFKPINPIDTTKFNSNNGLNRIQTNGNYDESAISALMSKSFELTGNGDYEEPSITRASSKWRPAGRIRAYDNIVEDYIPLQGVRVRARRWFTTHKGETDSKGYFKCDGKFKNPAHYSIVWDTKKYNIRDGNVVQAYYNGPKITANWYLELRYDKSIRYATIHRAAYRMFFGNIDSLRRPVIGRKINIAYHHKNGNVYGDSFLMPIGALQDIRIYGKSDNQWRDLSLIYGTTCHELGHIAHHTHNLLIYPIMGDKIRESWACFIQYLLLKLEYESLGYYYKLCPTEEYTYIDDNGIEHKDELWMIPDKYYNFQYWNRRNLNSSNRNNYTPLFIDLFDNYNQYIYHKYCDNTITNYLFFPNEDIHVTTKLLQDCMDGSRRLATVKNKLLDTLKSNPNLKTTMGLTENQIETLFKYYAD